MRRRFSDNPIPDRQCGVRVTHVLSQFLEDLSRLVPVFCFHARILPRIDNRITVPIVANMIIDTIRSALLRIVLSSVPIVAAIRQQGLKASCQYITI